MLGIKINHQESGVSLDQQHFIKALLEQYGTRMAPRFKQIQKISLTLLPTNDNTIKPTKDNTINGGMDQCRSCHQLTRGVLPLCFSPLPPSLIGMDAQSYSSDDHYSSHDEYNLPNETASVSQDTRVNHSVAQDRKRRHKRSDVYDYFEKITLTGEWMPDKNEYLYTYKCWHCSVKIVVMGCHTSNMNKHCKICAGRFNAWASKSPGLIDPNMGARLAAETQTILNRELVKGLVAIQVSFSIFESPQLRHALQCIAPSFQWPH
ncbi:hypothetical protein O181_042857 [Austropuccinia psidii MF-1]|uniref:Uncharacterized protein n=1 Tax=Austropuccinia psidii MF-1 TaxID=1389203 RepID=A0A9Q3HG88_9BASI|nr:hypothetical protein [Austropuccinia psidii MF-1]